MRWGFIVGLLITLAVFAAVARTMNPSAQPQDPTPASEQQSGHSAPAPASGQQIGGLEGITARTVASGSIEVLAPGTANLNFGRMRLAPGAVLPFDPRDPSAVLVYTSSGALTFRVEAPVTVARGVARRESPGTPVPIEPEAVAADTEFTLRSGDSALFPPAIAGEVRNDGGEEGIAWVVNVAVITQTASTPTP